ncbi:hypothetical protein SAMN04488069_103247 [Hymenobacter psychrophilus]|uniref:Uncharacterized protein n=1 Tax=Hymenobacter psychrophilus TaxID=651662 RepID=A0A1H3EPX8_9BACT|nr:hypothetical protein SAMN04488069_103247 [Hymenobacter psychrophilus]
MPLCISNICHQMVNFQVVLLKYFLVFLREIDIIETLLNQLRYDIIVQPFGGVSVQIGA